MCRKECRDGGSWAGHGDCRCGPAGIASIWAACRNRLHVRSWKCPSSLIPPRPVELLGIMGLTFEVVDASLVQRSPTGAAERRLCCPGLELQPAVVIAARAIAVGRDDAENAHRLIRAVGIVN